MDSKKHESLCLCSACVAKLLQSLLDDHHKTHPKWSYSECVLCDQTRALIKKIIDSRPYYMAPGDME